MHDSGISCRGNADACVSVVIARSEATKQSTLPPWKQYGLLRFCSVRGDSLQLFGDMVDTSKSAGFVEQRGEPCRGERCLSWTKDESS